MSVSSGHFSWPLKCALCLFSLVAIGDFLALLRIWAWECPYNKAVPSPPGLAVLQLSWALTSPVKNRAHQLCSLGSRS